MKAPHREWEDSFDSEFGVDTVGSILLDNLDIHSPHSAFANRYAVLPRELFNQALADLQIDPREYTFVDLGSGKGRALLLAAALPFKRIIGVEFSADLHDVAVENLRRYQGPRACRDIQPLHMDATCFAFPDEPLIVYIFDSFKGPVMGQVLTNLVDSIKRRRLQVFIIYVKPKAISEVEKMFALAYNFELLKNTPEYRIYDAREARLAQRPATDHLKSNIPVRLAAATPIMKRRDGFATRRN